MNHGRILTVLILALSFTGCSYWSEADRRRLEKLSEAIERNPNDPALIETLESGMRSEEHFRAKDHIFAAGDLSENPRVRAALVSVIEDRIFRDDPWTARVCAEQLPLIAKPNEVEFFPLFSCCLTEHSGRDLPWFALEAIEIVGPAAEPLTDDVARYLNIARDFENSSGRELAISALQAIGTPKALNLVNAFNNSIDSNPQEAILLRISFSENECLIA